MEIDFIMSETENRWKKVDFVKSTMRILLSSFNEIIHCCNLSINVSGNYKLSLLFPVLNVISN